MRACHLPAIPAPSMVADMTGDDIDARIQEWLYTMPQVKGYHHPDSRRATIRGFPDWVFISDKAILFREIKGSGDTLSREQREIGRLIMLSGGDWGVWWPGDVRPGGRAELELKAIA